VKVLLEQPEVLREYWIGANHQSIMESIQQQKQNAESQSKTNRRYAAGEGSSARPAAPKPGEKVVPGTEEGWGDL
jgi:hypothetical protein